MHGLRARKENVAMVLSISGIGDAGADIARVDYVADDTEDDREALGKDERKRIELTEQKSGIGWKFAGQGVLHVPNSL